MKLVAYSLVQKKKVPMLKAKIIYNNGRYLAMGEDKDGNTITLFMSEADAKAAVKAGVAKKSMGFK